MITVIEPAQNTVYNEDITLSGEEIIDQPCTVYDITLTNDVAVAAIVSIADIVTYAVGSRVLKVAVPAKSTIHLTFPRGKPFASGLSAAANAGSIDIAVTYD